MDDYPLYYEAFNEKGLGIAGLNFAIHNAHINNNASVRIINGIKYQGAQGL